MNSIADQETTQSTPDTRIVAVVDIGATSVRMMIAEVHADGTIHALESLSQAVQLGRDSFINGKISRSTIEDCVHVLQIYRAKLREYGIDRPEDVRVVATSAVREASNRLAFQDRVFIATGFDIEPFDESRLHRITFLGIKPILEESAELNQGQTIVCEVGGGTTELMLLEDGHVTFAQTYRLGALRLIKTLEAFRTPLVKSRTLMETQISNTINQFMAASGPLNSPNFVVMGGDMRLAAMKILQRVPTESTVRLSVAEFEAFTEQVIQLNPDQLVKKFQSSVHESESLAPALLSNLLIARALGVDELHVASVNLRDGLIKEMTTSTTSFAQAQEQVINSVIVTGRRFGFDEAHARSVDQLAVSLFQQTSRLHGLDQGWEILLRMAALLHEVGLAVNERSYHKHSMYIIRNSVFFGVGTRDLLLVALIARYHRRAVPQPTHDTYSQLNREDRASVSKLAAILRVAKALDASRSQRIQNIRCDVSGNKLQIFVPALADVTLEQLELRRERELFENVFGLKAELLQEPLDSRF
ncbi:MAG: exopolyphosphatase [Pirellulaceae bacterium]